MECSSEDQNEMSQTVNKISGDGETSPSVNFDMQEMMKKELHEEAQCWVNVFCVC